VHRRIAKWVSKGPWGPSQVQGSALAGSGTASRKAPQASARSAAAFAQQTLEVTPAQRTHPGNARSAVPSRSRDRRSITAPFHSRSSAHPSRERTQCRSLAQPRPEGHHCAFSQPQQRAPIPGTHAVPFPRAAATGGASLRLFTAAAARTHPGNARSAVPTRSRDRRGTTAPYDSCSSAHPSRNARSAVPSTPPTAGAQNPPTNQNRSCPHERCGFFCYNA